MRNLHFQGIWIIAAIVLIMATGCQREEPTRGAAPPGGGRIGAENEINLLNDILKQDPDNLQALIKLGNVYMDGGRFSEAVDAYGRALEIDPRDVNVRVDMGTCLRRIGMPQRSVEEYRKAISINPIHPFAHRNLGVVLAYDMGNPKEGAAELEKYLELRPEDPQAAEMKKEIERLRSLKQ